MNSRSTSPDEQELNPKHKDNISSLNENLDQQKSAIKGTDQPINQQISQNIGVISSSNISIPIHGPGIFFDMQKGEQFLKIESLQKNKTKFRSSSQCQFNGSKTSEFSIPTTQRPNLSNPLTRGRHSQSSHLDGLPQGSTKLFSPFEYLSYASKISESKDNLLNGLQQLGYANTDQLNGRSIKDVISKTEDIINKSYSLKYLGVIDGNMGVLSKRVKIKQDQNIYQRHYNQYKQIAHSKEHTNVKQLAENHRSNKSNLQSTYRPDLYNSYLITSYSLPKSLKPVVVKKDQFIIDEKLRLSAWHNQQLKNGNNTILPLDNTMNGNSSISIQQIDSHRSNKSDCFLDDQQLLSFQQEQQGNEQSKNNQLVYNHNKNNHHKLLSTQLLSTQALNGSDSAASTSIQSIISSRLNGTLKKNNQKTKQLLSKSNSKDFFIQNTFTQQSKHFLPEINSPDSQQQLGLNNEKTIINPSFNAQAEQNYPPSYSRLLNKIQTQKQQQLKIISQNDQNMLDAFEDKNNPSKDSTVGTIGTRSLSSKRQSELVVKDTNDLLKSTAFSRKRSEGFISNQDKITPKHHHKSQEHNAQMLKYTQNEQLQVRLDHISKLLKSKQVIIS